MSVEIRSIKPNDWKILRDIKISSIRQEPLAFENQTPELAKYLTRSEQEWREKLSEENRVTVFAMDEDRAVGMITSIISDDGVRATIQHVYVDKEHRGNKYAERMFTDLLPKLRQKGVKIIELAVLVTQTTAIDLYKRVGFKEKEYLQKSAHRGDEYYDEIEMEFNLN